MFLHVIDGENTINTTQITWIEWVYGEEKCVVHMACGESFTLIEDDYEAVKKLVGKK